MLPGWLAALRSHESRVLQVRNLESAAILAELGASTACISAALFHGALDAHSMSESRLRETLQHDVASLAISSARLADLCKVGHACTRPRQLAEHVTAHLRPALPVIDHCNDATREPDRLCTVHSSE